MPVSIVVGGQYGSEGKGKIAHWLAQEQRPRYAIRVGGCNSGHTAVHNSKQFVLRHLPTPGLFENVTAVIPPGAYLNEDILLREIQATGITSDRLLIHPSAVMIDDTMKRDEREADLIDGIGSTGQGVGGAVAQRAMRRRSLSFAENIRSLQRFIRPDLDRILASALEQGDRILVEGTQGFGLSILHGPYPYTTSRDTTAAGTLSEAGLSPSSVDCIAMVLRSFPIRVAGNSGPLLRETTWEDIARNCGTSGDISERTTVTGRLRRVAEFDEELVERALLVNQPDILFLNHVDHFDYAIHETGCISEPAARQLKQIEQRLGVKIDYAGSGPSCVISRPHSGWVVSNAVSVRPSMSLA